MHVLTIDDASSMNYYENEHPSQFFLIAQFSTSKKAC